jgi:phosphoglycerate-specific signal transduction histidine kinase
VLLGLGFARVTRSTIELIAQKYDKNGDSLVTYAEFCATIEGRDMVPEAQRTVVSRADRVEEAFRKQVLAASKSMQQVRARAHAHTAGVR